MKSIDTNILVRYYAQDDSLQSPLALRVFLDEPELFVTKTVLLEFFRVLTQADKVRFPPEQAKHLIFVFSALAVRYPSVPNQ